MLSKRGREQLLNWLTMLAALLMFFPILWMVLTSFKTEQTAFAFPPKFFFAPTLENWQVALIETDYLGFLANTLIITGLSTILALLLGIPAAYAMAFYPTKRTDGSMMWVMSTRMMPPVGVIVPLYVLFQWLNLLDTYLGMIIIYTAMNVPLVIWMLRSFMVDIPFEIIEAARMDGVTLWQEITAMILPLIVPGLAATALLC
ncbi:MAG: carbohydrate ABC transporter permease, partial [Caldilineaceae bacterium]|nr:carbohydrate ABC transporter permease [Caldilineaceae bacterium]